MLPCQAGSAEDTGSLISPGDGVTNTFGLNSARDMTTLFYDAGVEV